MFRRFSVCNGDADGLCSAVQWFMHEPSPATLVTGLKRELALLDRVDCGVGDEINIFDIAMSRKSHRTAALARSRRACALFDHHAVVTDVPASALFEARIDAGCDSCTSLLVDRRIGGACHGWALVGTYGDNLSERADQLAVEWGFDIGDRQRLRRMGEAIDYNAYGDRESDVHVAPARLYDIMTRYRDPRDMLAQEAVVDEIDALRRRTWTGRSRSRPLDESQCSVLVLPDEPWSCRALGSVANELANAETAARPHGAKAPPAGGFMVSVRAPLRASARR